MITNTIFGVPFYIYSIMGPTTLFYELRPLYYAAPIVGMLAGFRPGWIGEPPLGHRVCVSGLRGKAKCSGFRV